MGRNNTPNNTKTQTTQNKKQNTQNKKTYGWNGDNITLIFNVGPRWRRLFRLMPQPIYSLEEYIPVPVE